MNRAWWLDKRIDDERNKKVLRLQNWGIVFLLPLTDIVKLDMVNSNRYSQSQFRDKIVSLVLHVLSFEFIYIWFKWRNDEGSSKHRTRLFVSGLEMQVYVDFWTWKLSQTSCNLQILWFWHTQTCFLYLWVMLSSAEIGLLCILN